MKRITFLIFILSLAMLVGCNEKQPKNNSNNPKNPKNPYDYPIGDPYISSGHQFNCYLKMDQIYIKEEVIKKDEKGDYAMTVNFSSKEFYGWRTPKENVTLFQECAEKFGDTASKMLFPEPVDENYAISAFIQKVEITSAEGFDESHPSNSSFADLVRIEYLTAYPSIKNKYNPKGLEGLIDPNAPETSDRYGVQKINKQINEVTEDELALVHLRFYYTRLYRIHFDKLPTNPIQTITIKVTTDEGIYSVTKKLAFL